MRVVVEGMDRIGKTTQVENLVTRNNWVSVKYPFEGIESGKVIRKILNKELPYEPYSFQALMTINKMETARMLDELEEANDVVLLDRYTPSALAYGSAEGLPGSWLGYINGFCPNVDIIFVLTGEPFAKDVGIYAADEFQQRVKEKYTAFAKEYKGVVRINANQDIDDVTRDIEQIIYIVTRR